MQNAASVCLPFVPSAAEKKQKKRLDGILDKVRKVPEGEKLLRFLEEKEVKILFSRDTEFASYSTGSSYSNGKCMPIPQRQFILYNPDQDDDWMVSAFFHEARHLQQVFSQVIRPAKQVSPFDLAWHIRMIEADAEAESIMIALKNKLDGNPLLLDKTRSTGYEHMCLIAEVEYAQNPASFHDGTLKRMVFDAWFRETGFDLKQYYAEKVISEDWPCGIYATNMAGYGFTKSPLTCEDIQKIGAAGGESINYLTLPGFRPLDEPYYKEGFSDRHRKQLQELTGEWEKMFLPGQDSAPKKDLDNWLGR